MFTSTSYCVKITTIFSELTFNQILIVLSLKYQLDIFLVVISRHSKAQMKITIALFILSLSPKHKYINYLTTPQSRPFTKQLSQYQLMIMNESEIKSHPSVITTTFPFLWYPPTNIWNPRGIGYNWRFPNRFRWKFPLFHLLIPGNKQHTYLYETSIKSRKNCVRSYRSNLHSYWYFIKACWAWENKKCQRVGICMRL